MKSPTENCKTCKWRVIVNQGKCELSKQLGCVKPPEYKHCTCDVRTLLVRGCICGGK